MKKLILCLFGAFAMVGCNKETSTLKPSNKQNSTVNKQNSTAKTSSWADLCDVPNETNEYDYLGSEHNRLLAIYDESKESDMSLDEVYALTDEILHRELDLDPEYRTKPIVAPLFEKFGTEAELREFINEQPTTDLEKTELNNLITIMLDYDGTNLCETISTIKEFENTLLSTHSSSDIKAVLCASAVGRYSLAYWQDKVSTDPGIGGSMTMKWWDRFLNIALADAFGAGYGLIASGGNPIGGLAGGAAYSIIAAL